MGETPRAEGDDVPALYRRIQVGLAGIARVFFRELEVEGLEHVPDDRGGVIVSWHPNGLVDPWLILAHFPRQVVFGARHGLFRWPLLGRTMRALGTVPIYRAKDLPDEDPEARREANRRSLDALAGEVAAGSFSALFPEGVSHDEPHPVELKSGAARLYYRARALQDDGAPPPVVLPVGLHYDRKRLFRSRALVEFHRPLELPSALDVSPDPDEPFEEARARARELTGEIERVLHEVVHATEDWDTHRLMHRARKLVRAERAHRAGADPGRVSMGERARGFARIRAGHDELVENDPERVEELRDRIDLYHSYLETLGLEDHELDRDPPLQTPWLVAILVLQAIFVFLLLPPVLLVGLLANGPTALALIGGSKLLSRRRKDEASIKVLGGLVAFPLTWMVVGVAGGFVLRGPVIDAFPSVPNRPVLAGFLLALLAATGAVVATVYLGLARATLRAFRVRLTRRFRRKAIERLRQERSDLTDALLDMAEGLDLPGEVAPDGRIRPEEA